MGGASDILEDFAKFIKNRVHSTVMEQSPHHVAYKTTPNFRGNSEKSLFYQLTKTELAGFLTKNNDSAGKLGTT